MAACCWWLSEPLTEATLWMELFSAEQETSQITLVTSGLLVINQSCETCPSFKSLFRLLCKNVKDKKKYVPQSVKNENCNDPS